MLVSLYRFLPFYIIFLLMGAFDRILSTFSKKQTNPTKHIYHKWMFVTPFCMYLFIVIFSIGEFFLTKKEVYIEFSLLGLICFIAGALLRKKAISALGNNWSLYTELKEGHELITSGIYRYLKHPYYIAVILELIGITLVPNAFYALILVFLIQVPLLMYRIVLEEKILIGSFGDLYTNYKKRKIV